MAIPRPTEFLLSTPLYLVVSYDGVEAWDVVDLLYFPGTYDSYCPKCQRESTFQVLGKERPGHLHRNERRERLERSHGVEPSAPSIDSGVYLLEAQCTRVATHKQHFAFFVDAEVVLDPMPLLRRTIQKIGQQPSFGDLHIVRVKKYKHVLDAPALGELTRAIGLASHDVGVGAYVYLRRIFENLVEEAHLAAKSDPGWDEEQYQKGRMTEKVPLLKAHLPTFLVENASMYSLLSKGMHELSEEDCLKHFETLRICIELILDERIEARHREQKIAAAKAALQKAVGGA